MISRRKAVALQLVYQGARFIEQGNRERAERTFRKAARTDPKCFVAWNYLTDLLATSGRSKEALECLKELIATSDLTAANLLICGQRSAFLEQFSQARKLTQQALELDSSLENKVGFLMAEIEYIEGNWHGAVKRLTRILEAEPDNYEAIELRHKCWYCLGLVSEDMADTRRMVELRPDPGMHSRLLFRMNYAVETTPEMLYEESRRWNQLYAAPLAAQILPHTNIADPNRRLRIGYLSPDLRQHAIMKLLPAAFEMYDASRFEVFAYSVATQRDQATNEVQRLIPNFAELPEDRHTIASRIRTDRIDILVDLAGHTMPTEALLALALKPAPIQVTWLGSMATTGLDTVDYFIGDAHIPPPGIEHLFSEKICRLPRVNGCYRAPATAEIVAPPCITNGYITFGCFNNPRKLNRNVVTIWSLILHLVQGSKLILKYMDLERPAMQKHLLEWFQEGGIETDRISFEGRSANLDYFAAWNRVDIALDPFPYNGGTTTLDALWMGVPMVGLAGRMAVSAVGTDAFAAVGLPIGKTYEEYVSLAVILAQSMPSSPDIRQRVHNAMRTSALMDEVSLMRALEDAFRQMWVSWCAQQNKAA